MTRGTRIGETLIQIVFTGGATVACHARAQVHVDLRLGAGAPVVTRQTRALIDVNLTVGSSVAWPTATCVTIDNVRTVPAIEAGV